MLARAKDTADTQGSTNITWLLGSDRDLPALAELLGERTLSAFLEQWFKVRLTSACGTDQESRTHYATVLKAVGYTDVHETVLTDYEDVVDVEHVIGNIYSAMPASQFPLTSPTPHLRRGHPLSPPGPSIHRTRPGIGAHCPSPVTRQPAILRRTVISRSGFRSEPLWPGRRLQGRCRSG